jgi:tocopherol O-methyltransferase
MISCPGISKRDIRLHYDWSTAFYRLLWGPHIHHGLWDADESPAEAQIKLIEAAAARAQVQRGNEVVDIGCGMGGSSVYLANHFDCRVTGVTLSPVQRFWASCGAIIRGARRRTKFIRADAEQIDFPPASFDVVWSVECTEHLFDKPAFFAKAARWLRPGGRMMICAWLAGDEPLDDARRQRVYDVCEGFLCPSLGTAGDYRGWMEQAGLGFTAYDDWTDRVVETWEICRRRTSGGGLRRVAASVDRNLALFLDRFTTILEAYRSGAMRYGCLTARKPE